MGPRCYRYGLFFLRTVKPTTLFLSYWSSVLTCGFLAGDKKMLCFNFLLCSGVLFLLWSRGCRHREKRKNTCLHSWPKETSMCIDCSSGVVLGFAAQTLRACFGLALPSTQASLSAGTLQGWHEVDSGCGRARCRQASSGSQAKDNLFF